MNEKILQLKISLDRTKPGIWRRFIVEDSITFHNLHRIIQKVMGWENCHLYEFSFDDAIIEADEPDGFCIDSMWTSFRPKHKKSFPSSRTKLNEIIKKKNSRFSYLYDFGDQWKHSITVEKFMEKDDSQKYPICIAGERACPPEDCGSVTGYEELMKIRKDKNHPQYQERIVEWLGEDYNPELFVIDSVNTRLHNIKRSIKQRKLGRNEPCHCGSGIKYKKCCLNKDIENYGRAIKIDY